jgi:hypothetical protein
MSTPPTTRLRGVAIPSEHGGWGITLEPVALGLAVAPSTAGIALGVAALATFLFRTPFKIAAGDRRRGRRLPRTGVAVRTAALYGAVLVAAVVIAISTAGHRFWPPIAAGIPLMLIQAGYDVRSRSRRLIPEIAGPVGMGSVSAAIALAGGESLRTALGLWLVMALRSITAVVLVRAQLRRAKQQSYREWPVHLVAAGAAAVVVAAAGLGVVPWLGAAAVAFVMPFGWWSLWRPPVAAVVVGVSQTILGAVVVVLTAAGVRAGI